MPSPAYVRLRYFTRLAVMATATSAIAFAGGCVRERVPRIPERLDDSTFWSMVNNLSEPGGYFHSDNFVSNELGFQYVIDDMLASVGGGGVYVGRSQEHTSELQSPCKLVCRLLLEKKNQ